MLHTFVFYWHRSGPRHIERDMVMEARQKVILNKIKRAHNKCEKFDVSKAGARQELADAIREGKNAGITYRQMGEVLGISKTGVSSIFSRSK